MTGAFASHIGRIETLNETIHPMRMAQAAAMLGLGREAADTLSGEGTALPPLFHLFFTNNTSDAGALNPDGHEKLGGFMPDVTSAGPFEGKPVVRRMWAAGDISFDGHLRVGEMARRISTITSIEEKKGSTGPLIFVNVERVIEAASGRVTEKRTIVYREPPATTAIAPESQDMPGQDGMQHHFTWHPDAIQLFRFSALTWNGHRIHYDADHCRQNEGYPDLVTHGPFTAMMLALTATGAVTGEGIAPDLRGSRVLSRFRFRGTQPLFSGRNVQLHASADFTQLEARNHNAQQAMKANAEFG